MVRACDICGCESDEYWMHPYNIGSKTVWLCWECFKVSQTEANTSDRYRQHKLQKIHKAKRRAGKL